MDTIYRLVQNQDYQLRVNLLDSSGVFKQGQYATFSLGVPPDYALDIGDFSSEANTFVRDAFAETQGRPFSTVDSDNDGNATSSCSHQWGGTAGWYA